MAWRRYTDLDEWSQWAPLISSVDASGRELRPGLSGVVHGPLGVQVIFVVDDVDPEVRSWSWSVRSGPLRLALSHEVVARPTGGSVATLEITGPAPVVLGYLAPARVALTRLVAP